MNGAPTIRLSIALVTRNRPAMLQKAVASIRRQSVQPHEIIMADDSTDAYVAEVKAVADRWDCRYLRGPHRGLYANRNFAAVHCSGTHVRTMDDDHILPEDHLRQCVEAVQCDPFAIWTTGEIGYVDGKYYGTALTANQLHPSGVGGPVMNPDDNWAIADGSSIYPRQVFDRGFRMVEDYSFGSSYLEFGAYLYRRGFRSRCMRSVLVHHHARSEDLSRVGLDILASRLFASVCYNVYFRPNGVRAARYAVSNLLINGHRPQLVTLLPSIVTRARERWKHS